MIEHKTRKANEANPELMFIIRTWVLLLEQHNFSNLMFWLKYLSFFFFFFLVNGEKAKEHWGTFLEVQWLKLCLPMQRVWVWSLVRELRSHTCLTLKNQNVNNRSSTVTNSIKTFKMVCIKKNLERKKRAWRYIYIKSPVAITSKEYRETGMSQVCTDLIHSPCNSLLWTSQPIVQRRK